MGVTIRVPEFEIELGDNWGKTPEEVSINIQKQGISQFSHFLGDYAKQHGQIVILPQEGSFATSRVYIFVGET